MPEKQILSDNPRQTYYDWSHLPSEERCRQIRELITSPEWGCLSLDQRERWLDQFQDLTQ